MVNKDLIILGMIQMTPSHGYQLKKNIKDTFGNPHFKINNNMLYPTLAKLEKEGFIKGEVAEGEKMNKKVYHITKKGQEHLLKLVATPAKPSIEDFDFKVQAVFFDFIPKESRLNVIKPLYEAKQEEYQEALEKKKKYRENMSAISLTVLEYGIKEIENSIEFYKKLMELD